MGFQSSVPPEKAGRIMRICGRALEKSVGKSPGTRSSWASQVSGSGKVLMNFKPRTDMIRLASSKWTLISEQTVL